MITDPVFYLFALPAVLFLGLSKGGFAGVGMLATPLVALYLPPLQAAAIFLPILIAQDLFSVWVYRREWDAWNLKVMVPGALAGTALAGLLAAFVSDALVRLAVGVISVAFVLNVWFGRVRTNVTPTLWRGFFWGAASGFTSTLCQAGGPPYQIFVMPQRLPKMVFVGTTAIFFMIMNITKIVPYYALGNFTGETLSTSAALLPFAYLTNVLGIWLVRRVSSDLFYRMVYWLTLFIGLALAAQAVLELIQRWK